MEGVHNRFYKMKKVFWYYLIHWAIALKHFLWVLLLIGLFYVNYLNVFLIHFFNQSVLVVPASLQQFPSDQRRAVYLADMRAE